MWSRRGRRGKAVVLLSIVGVAAVMEAEDGCGEAKVLFLMWLSVV